MRTIDLGEIILTNLSGYCWEVRPGIGEDGKRHAVITEVYVVTDEDYTTVPEGQKRETLPLSTTEQKALDKLFKKSLLAAASREEVDAQTGETPEVSE